MCVCVCVCVHIGATYSTAQSAWMADGWFERFSSFCNSFNFFFNSFGRADVGFKGFYSYENKKRVIFIWSVF